MLESDLKVAEEQNAELVVFSFSQTDEKFQETTQHISKPPFLLSKQGFKNHFRNFYYFPSYELCNKLFKVQYLRKNRVRFREYSLKEKLFLI